MNDEVVKEIEDSVTDQTRDCQPEVLFETSHGYRDKRGGNQALPGKRRHRTAHSREQDVVMGNH